MKLVELLSALDSAQVLQAPDVTVTGITADSRTVKPGDLFVCIPGAHVDAHQFIPDAIRRGAVAVVTQRPWGAPPGIGAAVVPDARLALSALADRFYGQPSRTLKMVGVTGTNGKTTTAFLVEAIARAAGRKMGVIGTAGMLLGQEVLEGKSGYTTPEPQTIHRLLATMLRRGAWGAVMEVSSHALEQRRTDHCRFDVAVFTNLTHEHLDYHGDMENYFAAKARLFRLLQPGAAAVVNLDDPYGRRLIEEMPAGVRIYTYGFSQGADIRAEDVQITTTGSRYRLITPFGAADVEAPYLFGTYNVANAMAAVGAGLALGFTLEHAAQALRTAKGAPGRFERIDEGQDFTVVVDYAHTPDGFEKLLSDVARVKEPGSRIIMVFGSAGQRDPSKRPDMGRIAGEYCDVLVLTEEDPRTEDAMEIARQIASGVTRDEVEIYLIEDRVEAIREAIRMARTGDIVLITGKGRETELEVQHPTTWRGDVAEAVAALRDRAREEARGVRA
ncbi:MAG: UDP-N-acetylmuramoyl-L-alanyl-D-glutamate--2,6-diaminopimelate ligase [Symbiobacteriaceae bacterium]